MEGGWGEDLQVTPSGSGWEGTFGCGAGGLWMWGSYSRVGLDADIVLRDEPLGAPQLGLVPVLVVLHVQDLWAGETWPLVTQECRLPLPRAHASPGAHFPEERDVAGPTQCDSMVFPVPFWGGLPTGHRAGFGWWAELWGLKLDIQVLPPRPPAPHGVRAKPTAPQSLSCGPEHGAHSTRRLH